MGLGCGQGRGEYGCAVGAQAVVGIEHLAIRGIDLPVAVNVCSNVCAGLFPGGAVGAVDVAVLVHVAGQGDADCGRACPREADELDAGIGDAQQRGAFAVDGGRPDDGGAGDFDAIGACGFDGDDHGALPAGDFDGGGEFGFAHGESERGGGVRLQFTAPACAAPADGGAEVGGYGVGEEFAGFVVSVGRAAVGYVEAACEDESACRIVAISNTRVAATDAVDAPLGVADEIDALGAVTAHGGDAGIRHDPLRAVGEADASELAVYIEFVTRAIRRGEGVAGRCPGQAGGLVIELAAPAYQGFRSVVAVCAVGSERPALTVAENRTPDLRSDDCAAEALGYGAEGEAKRLPVGSGKPDACTLLPGRGEAAGGDGRLVPQGDFLRGVGRQMQIERGNAPVAEFAVRAVERAREREVVAGEREHGVGGAVLFDALLRAVDHNARIDLARASGEIPGGEAQLVHAVGP